MRTVLTFVLIFLSINVFATKEQNYANHPKIRKAKVKPFLSHVICRLPDLKSLGSFQNKKFYINRYQIKDFVFDVRRRKKSKFTFWLKESVSKSFLKGVNKNIELDAYVNEVDFDLKLTGLTQNESRIIEDYGLGDPRSGKTFMRCENFAAAVDYAVIDTGKVHLNMHPHSNFFDYGSPAIDIAQDFINQPSYKSIILLEYSKGRFGVGQLTKPNKETSVYVSPGGIINYLIQTDNLEVIYTGAMLNMCILNTSRILLDDFLQQSKGGVLNYTFKLKSLRAQKTALVDSNLGLKKMGNAFDLFSKDPKLFKAFVHKQYNYYLERLLSKNVNHLFKTVRVSLVSSVGNISKVIRGTGDKDFEFEIIYEEN